MAALAEGRNYALSSSEAASALKSVVRVKLTDSALRAIEDFHKNKRAQPGSSAVIRFKGSYGEIQIPDRQQPNAKRSFQFSLSGIQGDPNGTFECLHQHGTRPGSQLDSLGAITHNLAVHATDDVYKATKERMTQAEQESKKSCAQEIKPRGPRHSSVIKRKVLSSNAIPPPKRPSALDVAPSRSHSMAPRQTHSPSAPSKLLTAAPSPSAPAPPLQHRSTANSEVMARPFKERVLHLLAIRPFKKPELIARLQKDGIRDRDRQSLAPVLKQVALFNPRDNSYSLLRHLLSDVKDDWPFYTETDRQLLKRRRANADGSPAPLSPAHSPAAPAALTASAPPPPPHPSHPPPPPQKRSPPAMQPSSDYVQPPVKRQRVAHHSAKNDPNAPKVTASKQPKTSSVSNSNGGGGLAFSKEKLKLDSPNSLGESQENNNYLGDASPDKDAPDFVRQYPNIRSGDQRQKYKKDFNAEYEEYRQLHAKIDQVSNMFRMLVEKIQREEKGSEGYESMKSHIFMEYSQVKKDPKYLEQRKRCDYLYKKLGHIKKQITEYDLLTPVS